MNTQLSNSMMLVIILKNTEKQLDKLEKYLKTLK